MKRILLLSLCVAACGGVEAPTPVETTIQAATIACDPIAVPGAMLVTYTATVAPGTDSNYFIPGDTLASVSNRKLYALEVVSSKAILVSVGYAGGYINQFGSSDPLVITNSQIPIAAGGTLKWNFQTTPYVTPPNGNIFWRRIENAGAASSTVTYSWCFTET